MEHLLLKEVNSIFHFLKLEAEEGEKIEIKIAAIFDIMNRRAKTK